MNDILDKARGDVEAYKQEITNEEVASARARIDNKLNKNKEQLKREARIRELRIYEEQLAAEYDTHLDRHGNERFDPTRTRIAETIKRVANELAQLEATPEPERKLPQGVNDVWIKGKTGGRM
jgi:hypothetical protein